MSSAQKFAGGFALESMLYWIGYEVWRKDILAMVRWNVYNVTIYIAIFNEIIMHNCSRSLRWERGLKLWICCQVYPILTSFPSLGTWIEIIFHFRKGRSIACRSLRWERGLKYFCQRKLWYLYCRSLRWERGLKFLWIWPYRPWIPWSFPSLGTWIEIDYMQKYSEGVSVVPFAGNVDWISNKFPAYLP